MLVSNMYEAFRSNGIDFRPEVLGTRVDIGAGFSVEAAEKAKETRFDILEILEHIDERETFIETGIATAHYDDPPRQHFNRKIRQATVRAPGKNRGGGARKG